MLTPKNIFRCGFGKNRSSGLYAREGYEQVYKLADIFQKPRFWVQKIPKVEISKKNSKSIR